MGAVGIVLAELEALVVLVAPVLGKVVALDAEVVVAAHRGGVVGAAVEAELADVTAVHGLVAVAALVADEVAVGIVVRGADIVLAVLAAVLAEAAVFAELALVEAFAAVGTDVVVPVGPVGAELVLAMIVGLTVGAEAAVFALIVLRTRAAFGAEVVFILGRGDAVAMLAAFRLAVAAATFLAELAVGADFDAYALGAPAALRALPVVFVAAVDAVLAAVSTPLHLVAEAVAAFGAVLLVGSTALAEAALRADVLVALEALAAVDLVFGCRILHAGRADGVFHAGIAASGIRLFTADDHADAAHVALQFAAVRAVLLRHRVFAVARYGALAEQLVAIGAGGNLTGIGELVGAVVADVLVDEVVDAVVILTVLNASAAVLAVVRAVAVRIDVFRAAAAVRAEEIFGSGLGLGGAFGIDDVVAAALFAPGVGFAPGLGPLPVPEGCGLQQGKQCNGDSQ